ncbi:MAG TPA: 6-phosphogluconolactonase [Hyphomicrobiales bacterium]|nr:6-phosphogluconolactonase [Hyphomicrobiales bacterium]
MASISRANLEVVADKAALARAAAERVAARLAAVGGRGAVCLTGGSTPKDLYALLAARTDLPWARLHWFLTDERFVPPRDELSNLRMCREALLDRAPIPPENIHPIPTDAASPDEAAARYQAELKAFYGAPGLDAARPLFDVVVMGMGPDGHTASLFPGKPAVEETARWAVGVPEAGWEPFVPRVSLTLPVLGSCREMVFLIAGADKRAPLGRVLAGETLPSGRAWTRGTMVTLADRAATPEAGHGG